MRLKIFGSVALLLLAIAVSQAQTVNPSPTPPPTQIDDDRRVVKVTTSIIQVDVSVTDNRGRVITDLKPDEIEIYENGVKQPITGFSFVANTQVTKEKEKEKKADKNDPKANVPEPPLVLRPDQVRRTVALVVDDLTLSFESTAHVRRALKRFVDTQMQDGDLVGIIRTGVGIGALQQFTSNKQQLYAAIDRVKWNASGRGRFGSFDPVEPTMGQRSRSQGDEFMTDQDIQHEKRFGQEANSYRESLFATGTLGALKYIVHGMGELPGRKSVILFSDGFEIFPNFSRPGSSQNLREDGGTFGAGNAGLASQTIDFMRDLVDMANRKSVIFYTIDARGLETTSATAADSFADPTLLDRGALQSMQDLSSNRSGELFDTQQGLVFLAKQTGGLAYYNQNDLGAGVEKALNDQSFYLVAYEPDAESFDPNVRKFNKLEVKVLRKDTKVRHRSGFFVEEKKEPDTIRVDLNTPTKIMRALTSPFAVNDINVKLNALFGYSEKRGYYVHSFLHINTKDMQFTKLPNGNYQSVFDVLAISYGDNGQPVDKNNVTGTMSFKPEQYEKLLQEGFSYSFIFPVKKPGAYQMRVAIFDRGNKEVGSANQFIEVPNLKKSGVTLSGLVLENITEQAWSQMVGGAQVLANASSAPAKADPLQDTSLRKFKRGTILRYGVEVYNAKILPGQSQIRLQTRVFQDRKKVFEGEERQLDTNLQPGVKEPVFTDAVALGKNLLPGDYVLQVIVTDGLAKEKKRIATQYVQFEVVE